MWAERGGGGGGRKLVKYISLSRKNGQGLNQYNTFIREIKVHVYDIRQTANVSWEFLRIENKQLKTVQNDSFG